MAPICGGDGFSYQHECLAICQGVKVASKGLCAGDTTKFKGVPSECRAVSGQPWAPSSRMPPQQAG